MTNEVAKRIIKSLDYYLQNRFEDYGERNREAMLLAIKALEQEPKTDILDKVRAEIEREYKVESEHPYGNGLSRALEIIDKYRK